MLPLDSIINRTIQQAGGRIPFADFMQLALYHTRLGYYNRPTMTIGQEGDFYTSPMVHEIFGQCIARQIFYCWQGLGSPASFVIIEMGAGTGALARDVLVEWDRLQRPAGSGGAVNTEYYIVEQSANLRIKQQETAAEAAQGRISWYTTLEHLPGYGNITGVIITNELFDALPIHRLIVQDGRLRERYVTANTHTSGRIEFGEVIGDLSDVRLELMVQEDVRLQLQNGDLLEVCPLAGDVLQNMAHAITKGFILTVDYGDQAPDVFWKSVRSGGIRCYYRRALSTDPFVRVGEQDITADVDFSYLQQIGLGAGLETVAFTTQAAFLERLGLLDKVQELQQMVFKDLRADYELQRLLSLYLPDGLGNACKVLIQAKLPTNVVSK